MTSNVLLIPALVLSCVEGVAQSLLKTSSVTPGIDILTFGGMAAYGLVGYCLFSTYTSGADLSAIQVLWSIISSMIAVAQGWFFYGEPVQKLLVPFGLLLLARVTMPS